MTLAHAGGVAVVIWLLALGGLRAVGVMEGDAVRRGLVVACAVGYFGRVALASLFMSRRPVSWAEGIGTGVWFATIHVMLAIVAGSVTAHFSNLDVAALELYAFGGFITTKSEIDRTVWERQSENTGHLYTQGWFRFARHIDLFGDVMLFSGYALLTRRLIAFAIPISVLVFIVFVTVPLLDRDLARRYGIEFESYARRTKRLVPWIY